MYTIYTKHNVYYTYKFYYTHTHCMRLQTAPTLDRMLGNKPTLPLWVEDDDGEDGDGDGDDDIEDHQSNADFVPGKFLPWFQNGHQ